MPQPLWDGKTERRNNPSDHDNLTRLLNIVETLVNNFDKHVIEDKKNFDFNNRIIWIGFGALGTLELVMRLTGK